MSVLLKFFLYFKNFFPQHSKNMSSGMQQATAQGSNLMGYSIFQDSLTEY